MKVWENNGTGSIDRLVDFLSKENLNPRFINKDKHGFSRTILFETCDQKFVITWYKNESTLSFDGTGISPFYKFKYIGVDITYPSRNDWYAFSYDLNDRGDLPYSSFRIPICKKKENE